MSDSLMHLEHVIYMDANATLAPLPEVAAYVASLLAQPFNASSIHQYGAHAKQIIEEARSQVSKHLGAEDMHVVFTSCGTEANNWVLNGLWPDTHYFVSSIEHASLMAVAQKKEHVTFLPVSKDGVIDLAMLERELAQSTSAHKLVSVMLANNETGVIQPISEVSVIAKEYNALVHTDASQAVGKVPVDCEQLGVDLMTISGHKMGAIQGAAALLFRKDVPLKTVQLGGGQEMRFRGGTEAVALIAGLGLACELVHKTVEKFTHTKILRNSLETKIAEISKESIVFGQKVWRLPNTSCLTMPGVKHETQLIYFDISGVAVSSGSACSSGKIEVSPVLLAMGYTKEEAQTALRISLTPDNTEADIEQFVELWRRHYHMQLTKRHLGTIYAQPGTV